MFRQVHPLITVHIIVNAPIRLYLASCIKACGMLHAYVWQFNGNCKQRNAAVWYQRGYRHGLICITFFMSVLPILGSHCNILQVTEPSHGYIRPAHFSPLPASCHVVLHAIKCSLLVKRDFSCLFLSTYGITPSPSSVCEDRQPYGSVNPSDTHKLLQPMFVGWAIPP